MEAMKSNLQHEIEALKSKCAEQSSTIETLQNESKKVWNNAFDPTMIGFSIQEEYEKLQKICEDQAKQIESLRIELKKVFLRLIIASDVKIVP
eukprot:768261-Hanusia_phi.AAC.7